MEHYAYPTLETADVDGKITGNKENVFVTEFFNTKKYHRLTFTNFNRISFPCPSRFVLHHHNHFVFIHNHHSPNSAFKLYVAFSEA
jgi:hypothetical protein